MCLFWNALGAKKIFYGTKKGEKKSNLMQSLYLYLIIGIPLFPLLLSFDKRVHFVSNWKWAVMASFLVAIPFLIWDWFFTSQSIWGFNENYLVGINLINLPIEEVSFFFVVPF